MTYSSGFTSYHTNLKRIHCDSWEMKNCCVKNDTKTVYSRFLSSVSVGLILVFTQLIKTSHKSKTRVHFLVLHNNDFTALQDHFKVFTLSKNNLGNLSFIANWKCSFSSFSYFKQFFWHPNWSCRLEQEFLKIGCQPQTTQNSQVWEVS